MEPLIGVIYDFNRDEAFSGIVGRGAWLNGQQIQVSMVRKSSDAVLVTGFPEGTDFSQASLTRFVNEIRQYKKVRLLGSAALSLAYVACGRADVYHEVDIRIWDAAAGIALVKAAGGSVRISYMDDKSILKVMASNTYLL